MTVRLTGSVSKLLKGYGFIRPDGGERPIFFLVNQIKTDQSRVSVGSKVSYLTGSNYRGPCAIQVELVDDFESTRTIKEVEKETDLLAQAVVARERRQFELAERLYQQGLESAPTQALISSFAAMEKNRGRKKEAMDIYLKGIEVFPTRKLYEDAGTLASSLGQFSEAKLLLHKAISRSKPGTEGGVLLALGRACVRENTMFSLREAIRHYERAISLLGKGSILKSDLLALNTAKLRTQHHRGNLAYQFFRSAGFKTLSVELLAATTEGANLIVQTSDAELIESYGIESTIFVRVVFKAILTLDDLEDITQTIKESGKSMGVDDQVGLLITGPVPDEMKRILFSRIEDKSKLQPALVPLSQENIETIHPKVVLREVFSQWLYRRDLFNVNFPVVGRRFFGRNRDLDELREAIAVSTPIGLFGLRKVGKTSLLKELARRVSDNNELVVYIDLLRIPSDIKDFRWLYWKLASELYEATRQNPIDQTKLNWRLGGIYKNFLDVPPEFPVATAFDSDLTGLLRSFADNKRTVKGKVVLLLDEIERLLPDRRGKNGLEGFFDFFSYMRGVSQESGYLSLVVTGANAAVSEVPQFDERDNPVFNYFREIYLKLLSAQECNAMLTVLGKGMGVRFAKGSIPRIVSLTGGHPFFSRQFCSYLADYFKERPLDVSPEMIDQVLEPYLSFCDKDMREIFERLSRDYPEERNVCVQLAKEGGMSTIDDEFVGGVTAGTSLRHLVGYQLVTLEGGRPSLTMDLFKMWLNRRQEN